MLGKQNLQSKPSRLGHHEQQSRADAEPTQQRSLQLAKCHWRMAAMFTTGLLACIDRPMRRQATGKVRPSAYICYDTTCSCSAASSGPASAARPNAWFMRTAKNKECICNGSCWLQST